MTAITDHPHINLSIILGINLYFLPICKYSECILISFGKDFREISRCVFCLKMSWFKKSCQPVSGRKGSYYLMFLL
jgi:hypothetical protein